MGERVGSCLTASRNLSIVIFLSFLLGFIVTISEPDLQVLAGQVPAVPNMTLILSVACGVGVFLVLALLRMLFSIALPPLLLVFYAVVFIMALGLGVSAIRSDRHAADDSFGLVALCSVGPILAVMILGLIYNPQDASYTAPLVPDIGDSRQLWFLFAMQFPTYMKEISLSLLQVLAQRSHPEILVPIAMLIGYFIVKAEPAVYVLNKQVEEITDGAISAKAMGTGLSIGVALSLGLSMIRVLTGISILWFLIPGYAVALGTSFFVPKLYTAIAFDSGGVASGPMTAAFLLPLAQGACIALGGNLVTDAFGVVAMVAMTPLITVQVMGLVSKLAQKRTKSTTAFADSAPSFDLLEDDAIIEL